MTAADDDDDLETLAGEYVLGVLDPREREVVELRLAMDPELRRRVSWWEARLRPLAEAVPAATPSPELWPRIAASVAAKGVTAPLRNAPRRTLPRPGLWRSLALWRTWAAGASLAAASLAGWILLAPAQPRLIAVLGAPGEPSWLLTASLDGAELSARPVGPVERGPSVHELWLLPADGAPLSLGVLNANGAVSRPVPEPTAALLRAGANVAVSLEPPGGSPVGLPTGPVLYTGRLVADPGR